MAIFAYCFVAALVGLIVGAKSEARRWREKGLRGYPRMHSAGRLYWVNRDDLPCERCAQSKGGA